MDDTAVRVNQRDDADDGMPARGPRDRQPVEGRQAADLVETGARLSAGNNAILSRLCGGPCALDLAVEACLEPERFLAATRPPRLTGTAMNCFLVPP